MRTKQIAPALLALLPLVGYACECGMPHTMNIPGHTGTQFLASIRQEYISGDSIYAGESRVANEGGEYLNTARTSFLISTELAEGLSLFVSPQYLSRHYRSDGHDGIETGKVSGFGDLPMGVNYFACLIHGEKTSLHAGISAAATAPTGATSFLGKEAALHTGEHEEEEHEDEEEAHGAVHGHDLALGSGSWGGVFATRFILEHEDWLLEGNAHVAIRPEGAYGYDYAESYGWNFLAGGYVSKTTLGDTALLVSLTGDHAGNDKINGEVHDRTNHDMIYAGPAIRHNTATGATLEARVEVPVYIRTGQEHIAASWRAQASLSFGF